MSKQRIHVTKHQAGGWQVKKGGNSRASARTDTQKEAIDIGRGIAKREKTDLVIHGQDGKIRDSDSYGNDSCPPKDRKH